MSEQSPTPEPAPDPFKDAAVLDARSLRGVAHPLRWKILMLLQTRGPLTGKAVSEAFGIASASASYHLRQLHTYGFITEDSDRGTARERWWRAAHKGIRFPESLDTEEPELATAARMALVSRWREDLAAAVTLWSSQPPGWREAQAMADRRTLLTLEQAEALRGELREVLNRYARDPDGAPVGAGHRVVQVQLALFPSPYPEDAPAEDHEEDHEGGGTP